MLSIGGVASLSLRPRAVLGVALPDELGVALAPATAARSASVRRSRSDISIWMRVRYSRTVRARFFISGSVMRLFGNLTRVAGSRCSVAEPDELELASEAGLTGIGIASGAGSGEGRRCERCRRWSGRPQPDCSTGRLHWFGAVCADAREVGADAGVPPPLP